jgi:hypothetical protein
MEMMLQEMGMMARLAGGGGEHARRRRDLERGKRKDEAAARSGEGEEERRGERMGATARGSLIHVGTGAVWSAYENTWPDSGPDVAVGVEKGKIVEVKSTSGKFTIRRIVMTFFQV